MNAGRLLRVLRALVRSTFPNYECLGPRRYRVVRMNGDRLELQSLTPSVFPDRLPISLWTGLAGATSQPTPGTLVLVTFIEGDPSMPVVTHYSPKDGVGFLPVKASVDATDEVWIGQHASSVKLADGDDTAPASPIGRVVRYGDSILFSTPGPGTIVMGTPAPFSKVKA